MKMYKITKTNFWTDSKGNKRNYIKFRKGKSIKEVILFFGIDNILEVEEI